MANNNHPDYLESLFKGIDIILEKRLDDVSFDTTIICTITDASNSKNGEYRVTDGSVTYKVYSDLDSYKVGDQVRVSVPMGDFSQKKFIAGKYAIDNDSTPITYVSPLDKVVNMSGNLVPLNRKGSLTANGKDLTYIIWNQKMDTGEYADLQANGVYNTIILKADFRTLLSNYDLISGTYGLRLDLLVRPNVKSTNRIRRYVELSSKEMFGNPYAFSIASPQAKTFNISTVGIVEGIELSLYQRGDFVDYTIGAIPPNPVTDDIIVENIELGFGSDIINVDDNIVKIYSKNNMSYKYHNPDDDSNLKTLGLLWYNKDDNNQYVGFSDGIYAPQYDELEYLELARMDTRLLAQKGREGIPTDKASLNLAANIEEAFPLIQSARDVANRDLYRVLNEFRQAVSKITELYEPLDTLLLSSAGATYIGYCSDNITKALTNTEKNQCGLVQQYEGILDYSWDIQTQLPEDRRSTWHKLWENKYYEIIVKNFQSIRDNVNTVLNNIKTLVDDPNAQYAGYQSVYNVYSVRIARILTKMDEYLGVAVDEDGNPSVYNKNFPSDVLNGVDYNLLQSYQTKTEFKTYQQQDLSAYDNKYCIYWYHYERGYVSPDKEALMPDGWRRLTPDEQKGEYDTDGINVGLSTKDEEKVIDGKMYHAKTPAVGKGLFDFYMSPDLNTEKFVAIVFYNHNMYKSDELVFTNSDVIPDKTTLDKGDILIFEHGERSSDNFSLYTDLGVLMDTADEHYNRQIKVHYDGLLAKDEAMVGAGIYWYVPNADSATMLTFDAAYLKNRGFTTDLDLDDDQKPEHSKPGYVCFYKQVQARKMCSGCGKLLSECSCAEKTADPYWDYTNGTDFDNRDFWYKIRSHYDEGNVINKIICEVRISEDKDPIAGEQLFTFGISGTNGTKYTLDIVHTSTMIATTESSDLTLDVFLKNRENERLPLYHKPTSGSTPGEAYNCNANWLFHIGSISDVNHGLRLLTIEEGEDVEKVTGLTVMAQHFGIVEVTADFAMPIGEVEGDSGDSQKKREVKLDCLQAIPWAANNYVLSGPTRIVYNNYGTLDGTSMYDTPYKLMWERDQYAEDEQGNKYIIAQANSVVPDISWRIKYYIKDSGGTFVELQDTEITAEPGTADFETQNKAHNLFMLYKQYMPVINDGGGLTPSTLYLENLDCFAVVQAINQNKSILWEQPIIIVQNRYASAMLNSWDGSLTIDEKNGTIMSTMIGAGRKSDNNTFEGVLMGNIALGTESDIGFEHVYTDDTLNQTNLGYANHTGLGLYGFHDGSQSFGFNIEGSAFLGKAGSGRIIFNGNYGVIASSNWFAGDDPERPERGGVVGHDSLNNRDGIIRTSTAGMCIDLVNGHMDAYDFKLTGSRIHFNSHPEMYKSNPLYTDYPDTYGDLVGYLMRIGHDGKTKVDYAESRLTPEELAERATPGYMMMDGDGNLTIRVNSLYITEALGGVNLLQQTSPRKTIPLVESVTEDGVNLYQRDEHGNILYDWDTTAWEVTSESTEVVGAEVIDTKPYPLYVKDVANGDYYIYQIVEKPSKVGKYTLSGWVRSDAIDSSGTLNLTIYNCREDGTLEESEDAEGNPRIEVADQSAINLNLGTVEFGQEWIYFEYTIKINSEVSYFKVGFDSTCNFYLWHAMLEQGSVATTWSPSPEDNEFAIENSQNIYDLYLNQDEIFSKLIQDPLTGQNMVGIWLIPIEDEYGSRKELYINATYIATGILRSSNWDGSFKVKSEPKVRMVEEPLADENGNPILDDDGNQKTTIKQVVVQDEAGQPVYINTYTIDKHPTQGVYFNLNEGKMWAANFELTAGTTLYLNSNPAVNSNYFRIGNNDNYIEFKKLSNGTSLTIDSSLFTLSTNTIYFSDQTKNATICGASRSNIVLDMNDTFGVSSDGKLYASDAIITGDITCTNIVANTSGTIGGWILTKGKLYSGQAEINGAAGTMTFGVTVSTETEPATYKMRAGVTQDQIGGGGNTGSTPSGAQGYFHVSNTGHVTATGATITGTINAEAGCIGGWNIGAKNGSSSNTLLVGGNLTLDSAGAIKSTGTGAFSLGTDGVLTATGAVLQDLKVKNKLTVHGGSASTGGSGGNGGRSAVAQNPSQGGGNSAATVGATVLEVDSSGNLKFNGTLTLGPLQLTGYGGSDTDNNGNTGYTTLNIDTPWSANTGKATFYNGILVGWAEQDPVNTFKQWLVDTFPGLSSIIKVAPSQPGQSTPGVANSTIGSSTHPVWINDGLFQEISTGSDKQVLTTTGTGNSASVGWSTLPTLNDLLPSMTNNKNKVLKVNSSGNGVYWGTDENTTYDLSSASVSYADSAGSTGYADSAGSVARGKNAQTYVTTQGTDDYGACYRGPTVSSLSGDSSRRFKHDIQDLINSESLYKLQPVSYYYNDEAVLGSNKRYGFIAEDVLPLAPELVEMDREDNTLCQAIYYNSILTLAVAEIQKLRKELDDLKSNFNI